MYFEKAKIRTCTHICYGPHPKIGHIEDVPGQISKEPQTTGKLRIFFFRFQTLPGHITKRLCLFGQIKKLNSNQQIKQYYTK